MFNPPSAIGNNRTLMRDIRRHIGQLAIVGFKGHTLPPDVRALAREFDLGGVIFFARNVEAPRGRAGGRGRGGGGGLGGVLFLPPQRGGPGGGGPLWGGARGPRRGGA